MNRTADVLGVVSSFLRGRKAYRDEQEAKADRKRRLDLEEKRIQAGIDRQEDDAAYRELDRQDRMALKREEMDRKNPQPSTLERIVNGVRGMLGAEPIPMTGGIVDPVKASAADLNKARKAKVEKETELLPIREQNRSRERIERAKSAARRSKGGGGGRGSSIIKDAVDLVGKAGSFAGKFAKGLGGGKPADPEVERGRKLANDRKQDEADNRVFLDNDAPRIARRVKELTAGGFMGFGAKDPGPLLDQIEHKLEATDPKKAALLRRNRAAILAEINQ